jgi:hypothetical protein
MRGIANFVERIALRGLARRGGSRKRGGDARRLIDGWADTTGPREP